MKLLIIFGNSRSGLAIARSYSAAGHMVYHLRQTTEKSEIDYSNAIQGSFFLASPIFKFSLLQSLFRDFHSSFEYLVPVNDMAYELLYSTGISDHSKYHFIPQLDSYRKSNNKFLVNNIFSDLFAKCFPQKLIRTPFVKASEIKNYSFPLYVKPINSSKLVNGIFRSFKVKKVYSLYQLRKHLRDSYPVSCIIQEVIDGVSIGINTFSRNGSLISIGITKRLHQPMHGGGSSYRESIGVTDLYLDIAKKVVSKLNWSGYMMIECIQNDLNIFLVEINPRPWGSLPLTIKSGLNLPLYFINHKKYSFAPIEFGNAGFRSRHLAKDIKWIFQHPKALLLWFWELRYLFTKKESLDVEKLNDFKPIFFYFIIIFNFFVRNVKRFLPEVLLSNIDLKSPIVFVCKGNINRSIVAQILSSKFEGESTSCSLIPKPNRLMSQNAQKFLGLDDLSVLDYPSKHISSLPNHFSQFIVFEKRHMSEVRNYYPSASIFLFSFISNGTNKDINDPESLNYSSAIEVFKEIKSGIKKIYG